MGRFFLKSTYLLCQHGSHPGGPEDQVKEEKDLDFTWFALFVGAAGTVG